ncbi:MAG: cyclase, partial [Naasia sp.]|nr:cyclase [Naasia sp.]
LGTLNLITPERVAEAGAEIRTGRTFPLGITFDTDGAWGDDTFRINTRHFLTVDGGDERGLVDALDEREIVSTADRMLANSWRKSMRFADDVVIMSLQSATQWDGLAHAWYDDRLYNDVPASSVTSRGAGRNGIEHVARRGIVGRAVLLDVAGFRGVDHLPANEAIYADELDAVCATQGSTVTPGDILLVRTGWWSTYRGRQDAAAWRAGCPGLSWTAAEWLFQKDVAAVAADNLAVEASGQGHEWAGLPMHMLAIRDMGLTLGEMWNLDDIAADCREDGRYSMLLAAPPLAIPGAVGSPINPVVVK